MDIKYEVGSFLKMKLVRKKLMVILHSFKKIILNYVHSNWLTNNCLTCSSKISGNPQFLSGMWDWGNGCQVAWLLNEIRFFLTAIDKRFCRYLNSVNMTSKQYSDVTCIIHDCGQWHDKRFCHHLNSVIMTSKQYSDVTCIIHDCCQVAWSLKHFLKP